jgi:predicted ATPase/DNA-binding CsgD family transcriptional regulator
MLRRLHNQILLNITQVDGTEDEQRQCRPGQLHGKPFERVIDRAPLLDERSGAEVIRPYIPTTLFGRDIDRSELLALLQRDETSLVTLLGPGGIGKTRLALALADDISQRDFMEICFVDLTEATTVDRMLDMVVDRLELGNLERDAIEPAIAATLRARMPLLILDNLEQVDGAAPAIGRLLATCPGLTILGTSRRPLRLQGERLYVVSSLGVPDASASLAEINAGRFPAIDLFVDRATMVQPAFRLTDANRGDVRAICERVDGLPLAIELAASRLRLFSPSDLLAHLRSHLSLLSLGPSDLPERQQTIRQAIAWSADLLTIDERRVLECCAVFAGGFTVDAAIAVCAYEGEATQLADLLTSLLDQSLVQSLGDQGTGSVRFRLLQTVRDFGLQSLAQQGLLALVLDRHVACYKSFAKTAEAQLFGPDQSTWLRRMEIEHDNFRAALSLLIERADAASALSFAADLWPFWYAKGHTAEGRQWIERILALPGDVDQGERAKVYNGLGALCSAQGNDEEARRACDAAIAIWRAIGDRRSVANGLSNLSVLAEHRGEYAEALRLNEEALRIFQELRDRLREAWVVGNIAVIAHATGDQQRALTLCQRALGIFRALKDTGGIARTSHNLGIVLFDGGDLDGALRHYEAAARLFEQLDDPHMLAESLNSFGAVRARQGDLTTSDAHYHRAYDLAKTSGDGRETASALQGLGLNAIARGDYARAMDHFREGLELRRQQDDDVLAVTTLEQIALIAHATGHTELAATLIGCTDRQRRSTGYALHAPPALSKAREALRGELRRQQADASQAASLSEVIDLALAFDPQLDPSMVRTAPVSAAAPTPGRDHGLTDREIDVLRLIAEGKTNSEIGATLFISPFTAKTHVANLLGKLGAESRAVAAAWAARQGLL